MFYASRKMQVNVAIGGRLVFPQTFSLRQAFWFMSSCGSHAAHFFWLETLKGPVNVVRVRGLEQKNPEALIPYFAGIDASMNDDQLSELLLEAWLFPPQIYVKILRDAPLNPAVIIREELDCDEAELAELQRAAADFFSRLDPKIIKWLGPHATVDQYHAALAWMPRVFRNANRKRDTQSP